MLHTLGGQPGEECLLLLGPVDNRSAGRFGDLDPTRDAPPGSPDSGCVAIDCVAAAGSVAMNSMSPS
jgi:hypothetical protein